MNSSIVNNLKQKAIILTPSRRLASYLLQEIDALHKGQSVWPQPKVYAIDDWLHSLWNELEVAGLTELQLLTTTQSVLKFEQIIQAQTQKKLIKTLDAAKTAFSAREMMLMWETTDVSSTELNLDQKIFTTWLKEYQAWCQSEAFIDKAQLYSALIPFIKTKEAFDEHFLPPCIVFFGFEELAPLLCTFINTLEDNGITVEQCEPFSVTPASLQRVAFIDETQEFVACATWAKALLEAGEKNITVVVPDLANKRTNVEKQFNDVLSPLWVCHPTGEINSQFNVSAAIPLIQYPLIQSAFTLLTVFSDNATQQTYLETLNSPFIQGAEKEQRERAQHALDIQQRGKTTWSLKSSLFMLNNLSKTSPLLWREHLSKAVTLKKEGVHSLLEWADWFNLILNTLGWPGERPLSSIEFQVVKRFYDLLDDMGHYDRILGKINFHEALRVCQQLASNIPFQAQDLGAPIQVLGLLEAMGQHTTHLWVSGFTSDTLPAPATPNPFIPIALQRKLNMPHSSAQRELVFARRVAARLRASAEEVIFSYPTKENQKRLTGSEFISDIPLSQYENALQLPGVEALFEHPRTLEWFDDTKAPWLQGDEQCRVNASLLRLQALCPFRAFSEGRLGLDAPIEPTCWLAPFERGLILHHILECFWKEHRDHEKLMSLDDEQIGIQFHEMIEHCFSEEKAKVLPSAYLNVEKNRMYTVLMDYIQLEKARNPFSVLEIETQKTVFIEGVSMRFRVDRIDKDTHGNLILVDYKTGKINIHECFQERPTNVQLPLYSLALKQAGITAITAIKLASTGCEFEGIAKTPLLEGIHTLEDLNTKNLEIPREWEQLNAYFISRLTPLIKEFLHGVALVDPTSTACDYCHLSSVCRIHEECYHA